MNTSFYVMNRALTKLILNKTLYKLYFGRKPNNSHFYIFGCKCYAHNNDKGNFDKFDYKFDESFFIRYSSSSKTFSVFNKKTLKIKESIHVVFDKFSSNDNRWKNEKDQGDWMTSHTQPPQERTSR